MRAPARDPARAARVAPLCVWSCTAAWGWGGRVADEPARRQERAGVVVGSKASLAASGVFGYCQAAISPAGEVAAAAFELAVAELSDAAEHVPLAGKRASLACLPAACSRNNSPARPDAVPALIKAALAKRDACVVVVAPREHLLALVAAVVRAAPPLFRSGTALLETCSVSLSVCMCVCVCVCVRACVRVRVRVRVRACVWNILLTSYTHECMWYACMYVYVYVPYLVDVTDT